MRDARLPPLQNAAFGALRDVGSFPSAAESMAVVGGVPFILGVVMEDLSAAGSAQVCSVFSFYFYLCCCLVMHNVPGQSNTLATFGFVTAGVAAEHTAQRCHACGLDGLATHDPANPCRGVAARRALVVLDIMDLVDVNL